MRVLLLVVFIAGCAWAQEQQYTPLRLQGWYKVVHEDKPLMLNGKVVGAWVNLDGARCVIHMPHVEDVGWLLYMKYLGHELAHCMYGHWHD